MSEKGQSLSAKAQESLGMIPGSQFFSPFPFSGMNVQSSSIAMDDKEFRLLRNFFRIGDGKLRTAWDIGSALYMAAAGKTIIHFYAFNIGPTNYFAIFLNDGTGYQVDATTGAVITISATPGLFYLASSGFVPATGQWGTLYLLISNRNTPNDYWIWDGISLFQAGTFAPGLVTITDNGANYTSAPTVTAFGGHGSGATFTATVNAGGVIQIVMNTPGSGYEVGDVPQLAFSGGGSDTSAELVAVLSSGAVAAANITAAGTSYTSAPTIAFSGGGGTGAAATATISGGVSSITLGSAGTGYTSPPTVTLTGGGGGGATATAAVSGGNITGFTVTNPGSGYTSAPTVVIGGPGTGGAGTAVVNKGVTGIIITSPGSGYTSAPAIAFSGGGGTGATATALLTSSGVASVNVVNGGSGFFATPLITFEGGGGSGATGTVLLTGTSLSGINVTAGGSGYFNTPTVTIAPPTSGTTATAVANINNGSVVSFTVTDAGSGYDAVPAVTVTPTALDTTAAGAGGQAVLVPTSIASVIVSSSGNGYTDAPAVVITPGANNSAYATLTLMPFGISGSSLETFQSRVWIADPADPTINSMPQGGNFAVSAPGSLTDFATSDGGLLFSNTDSFLQTKYVAIRQSNGYLYFFGDGSVSVVSNVQTSGSPATTTFNYQNVDPQIGMSWRDSRQDFSRTILFGNETGVYGLYGGACTKVSGKLDDIFTNAVFPPATNALTPTSAVMTIFDVKHYFMLMTIQDPDTAVIENVMVSWNEREWALASQGASLTIIGSQKIGSKLYAWGTDGVALYPLFNTPSATLEKFLDTKLYGANSAYMIKDLTGIYVQAQDKSSTGSGVALNVELVTGGIAAQNPDVPSVPSLAEFDGLLQPPNFLPGTNTMYFPCMASGTGGIPFITMGINLTTTSPDFVLGNIMLMYNNLSSFNG